MRGFLDRDFLETDDGLIFCVVGTLHPPDRVLAYLKYAPTLKGRWRREEKAYARKLSSYSIASLARTIKLLRGTDYVSFFKELDITMSAVPHTRVARHYKPEEKIQSLVKLPTLDSLQQKAVNLCKEVGKRTGISDAAMGLTGSILLDIHNPRFSDIDLVVYGKSNGECLRHALPEIMRNSAEIRRMQGKILEKWLSGISSAAGLSSMDADRIYQRVWNRGEFQGTVFSIHPAKRLEENSEVYGTKRYVGGAIVSGEAEIETTDEGIFYPSVYGIADCSLARTRLRDVREIAVYNSFYTGVFKRDDQISFRGKLERVIDCNGEQWLRIVIGSLEGKGLDSLKLKYSSTGN